MDTRNVNPRTSYKGRVNIRRRAGVRNRVRKVEIRREEDVREVEMRMLRWILGPLQRKRLREELELKAA
jgi:hypothetical protein